MLVLQGEGPADALPVWGWVGPAAAASLEQAARGDLRFQPVDQGAFHGLAPGQALWLRLRLQASPGTASDWVLEFPLPILDGATLYQPLPRGGWSSQAAGDTVPMRAWTQQGRYPFFRLQLRENAPLELFVQVRHATPVSLPVRILTAADHYRRTQLEYLGLGLALGALGLLVAHSVFRAWRLRDSAYGWYAAYSVLAFLALVAFTGVAAHLLWGNAGAWVDAAPGCCALLAGSVAMLMVGHLSGVKDRSRRLGRAVQVVGWAGFAAAVPYLYLDRRIGIVLLAAHLLFVAVLSLWVATQTWRRGDPVGRWMLLGSLPLAAAVLVALARVLSWIHASWLTEYAVVLALTVDLPMLLGALNSRSNERRGAELRQIAAASQDPLTGLLKSQAFYARLLQAVRRFRRRGEGAAIAVIELANYGWIKEARGAEAAEESLLRAVIKLRRLVRDVDTTGRLGEARFGLILEGVSSRQVVANFASRLVAAGLMEEPGRADDVALRLHIAAMLLHEHAPPEQELMTGLVGVLKGMSARTHRPFRFWNPHEVRPTGDTSGGLESGLQPLEAAQQRGA